MKNKLSALVGKRIKLCSKLSTGKKVIIFDGNLSLSFTRKDTFVIGDRVVGPTLSFTANQLVEVNDNDIVIKTCLKR